MILPRGRSPAGMTSIERSRLVLSLSFIISSLSSSTSDMIKRSYLGVEPQRPNQPTQFGVSLQNTSSGSPNNASQEGGTDVEGCIRVAQSGHDERQFSVGGVNGRREGRGGGRCWMTPTESACVDVPKGRAFWGWQSDSVTAATTSLPRSSMPARGRSDFTVASLAAR